MRERRHHERGVGRGRARHQVAEVVGHDEAHLPVRQHARLRPPRGAGREEEPAGVVVSDGRFLNARAHVALDQAVVVVAAGCADGNGDADARRRLPRRGDVGGELAAADHRRRAARLGEVGDLARRLAEVGRHPDRAQAKAGEHRLEELVAVPRLDEHAIALAHAAGGQRGGHGIDPAVQLGPGPGRLAPHEADLGAVAPDSLAQEVRQVHDAPRDWRGAAHPCRSRIDT